MKGANAMMAKEMPFEMESQRPKNDNGYFQSVRALSEYHLEVTVATGSVILFDFRSRLGTARFGMLMNEELFQSVHTDGHYLIFYKEGMMPVRITAFEFMDLVLIDRSK